MSPIGQIFVSELSTRPSVEIIFDPRQKGDSRWILGYSEEFSLIGLGGEV